ncbi:MAG: aminopeptidase, partial [Desulfuromusa sp.]|nr:aminopeptidase [Desulfuromusa sp.]
MKITVKKGAALQQKTTCLVFGVFSGKTKEEQLLKVDQQLDGALQRATKSKEFSGNKDEVLLLHGGSKALAERILLVGLGKEADFSLRTLRQTTSRMAKLLAEKQLDSFLLALPQISMKKADLGDRIQAIAEGVLLADYRYDRYLPKDKPGQPVALKQVELLIAAGENTAVAKAAVVEAEAIISGVCFARDLVNAPGNLKSPEYLAMQAVAMAEQVGIRAKLLDRRELERQGFGALLG